MTERNRSGAKRASRPAKPVRGTARATPLADRLRRGELLDANCPSRDVLMHVTSRWGVLVLIVLGDGMHRFSELRRKIGGVSEKMLAQTLQALESDGFVSRRALPVVPPHVEYSLTPLGREVAQQVSRLGEWIELNISHVLEARKRHAADSE